MERKFLFGLGERIVKGTSSFTFDFPQPHGEKPYWGDPYWGEALLVRSLTGEKPYWGEALLGRSLTGEKFWQYFFFTFLAKLLHFDDFWVSKKM